MDVTPIPIRRLLSVIKKLALCILWMLITRGGHEFLQNVLVDLKSSLFHYHHLRIISAPLDDEITCTLLCIRPKINISDLWTTGGSHLPTERTVGPPLSKEAKNVKENSFLFLEKKIALSPVQHMRPTIKRKHLTQS